MEFFLNEFPWIQRIQRIMTKSQSGMVTKWITQLATNTLPVLVIQSAFSLLQLGGYLLSITTLNRYQPRDSSRKIFFTITSSNTSIVSYGMSLVTILFLDLIMVHWIHWIQRNPFRKNSNVLRFFVEDDLHEVAKGREAYQSSTSMLPILFNQFASHCYIYLQSKSLTISLIIIFEQSKRLRRIMHWGSRPGRAVPTLAVIYQFIWVFPKWLSVNSANSVNYDQIQGQYGYQRHSILDNRYITCCSGKREFSITIYRLVTVQSGEWQ